MFIINNFTNQCLLLLKWVPFYGCCFLFCFYNSPGQGFTASQYSKYLSLLGKHESVLIGLMMKRQIKFEVNITFVWKLTFNVIWALMAELNSNLFLASFMLIIAKCLLKKRCFICILFVSTEIIVWNVVFRFWIWCFEQYKHTYRSYPQMRNETLT